MEIIIKSQFTYSNNNVECDSNIKKLCGLVKMNVLYKTFHKNDCFTVLNLIKNPIVILMLSKSFI